MKRLLCFVMLGGLLTGCGTMATSATRSVPTKATEKCTVGLEWQVRMLDLKGIFDGLARELCTDCRPATTAVQPVNGTACGEPAPDDLLVTDFVDLSTLEPKQSGILLGESMRSSLSRICCRKIQQVELAKYFKLTEKGLVALTRDADKIVKDQFPPRECVVGTYVLTADKLILFAKRINLADGSVVRMSSREITFSCTESQMRYSVQ